MLNDCVVKIAKQIYALDFRKIKNKNKIVLMDNKFDVSFQYVHRKIDGKQNFYIGEIK